MKNLLLLCPFFLLFSLSCASLNVGEIEDLERQPFSPLTLKPAVDFSLNRIDIIRRQQEGKKMPHDTVNTQQDVPYSFPGFDLGNDIFLDFNGNLSFRIDGVMNVPDDHYRMVVLSPGRNGRIFKEYSYAKDTACVRTIFNKKLKYQYHKTENADTLTIRSRGKKYLTVVRTDTVWHIMQMFTPKGVLRKTDEQHWYYRKDRPENTCMLRNDTLFLGKTYLITLADEHREMKIFRYRKKKPVLLYRVVRGSNGIFFFDRHYRGGKLFVNGDTLQVWHNRDLTERYYITGPGR